MSLLGDARTAALGALIDYAGLFPPASLDMADAVATYRRLRTAPESWLVGRFLCPTSKLEALAGSLTRTMSPDEPGWSIGAVFDEELGRAADHGATFHQYARPAATVSAAEVGLAHGVDRTHIRAVALAALGIDEEAVAFIEVPITERWEEEIPIVVDGIADVRSELRRTIGAKLRCGGPDVAAFPSPEQVAMFVIACEQRGLPFKATAGLHHPIRHHDGDLDVMRHGFLNLIAAAAVAAENAPFHDIAAAVAETDPEAFDVGAGAFSYRNHRFPTRAVHAIRSAGFVGFGSCDIDEPIAEMRFMGVVT